MCQDNNKIIMRLLELSLKNKKQVYDESSNIDWNDLLYKVNSHQITSLVYNSIDKKSFNFIDKDIINIWRRYVFQLNIDQIKKVNKFKEIIYDLKNENIDMILLKGIVIRNYYPKPEFRTMGDLDILISKDNFEKVKNYFIDKGFILKDECHPVHAEFIHHDDHISVEIHWKLMNNETYVADTSEFEKNIWNNTIDFNFYGINVKIMSKEDFLLHLCIHMAKHLRGSGFGLRQVYDIAAFSLKEQDNMNMELFEEKARRCKGLDFSVSLFKIINQIFNLNLFRGILDKNQGVKSNLNLLLEEILSYDIFKEDERKIFLSKITFYNTNLLSKKGMHKEYHQLKRDFYNRFKDDNIKRIITRRRILLKEFSL